MSKFKGFIIDFLALISISFVLIYVLFTISNSSVFNAFSKIKLLKLNQVFIGLIYSLSVYSIIQLQSLIFYGFIKDHFKKYKYQAYSFFSFVSNVSVPIFFVTWMLLSLKENQFNIVTSILASTALFSELKTGHKFFNKLEIFHFFIDFEDHDK